MTTNLMIITSVVLIVALTGIFYFVYTRFKKKKNIKKSEEVFEPQPLDINAEFALRAEIQKLRTAIEEEKSKNVEAESRNQGIIERLHELSQASAFELSQKIILEKEKEMKAALLQKDEEMKLKIEVSRKQTRAVNFGNHAQHSIVPILGANSQGMSTKDIRWFGDTVDFICFKGLDENSDNIEIIFVDSKTSKNAKEVMEDESKWATHKSCNPANKFLSHRQKKILYAVKEGRISFQIWMTDDDGNFGIFDSKIHHIH